MVILGIDFGLSRVGLAIADDSLAQPLGVVVNSSKLIDQLLEICRQNKVEKIVIGLPEGRLVKKVKKFGQELQVITGLPVEFQDETLTSKEALDKMIEAGKKRKARQEKKDAFAAGLILQEFLEKKKNV